MSKEKVVRIAWVLLGAIIGASITALFLFNYANLSPLWKGELEGVQDKTQISINDVEIEVYVARTEDHRHQGLSNIELEEFDVDGMLFIFEDFEQRTFWMEDMKFAIDIVWMHDGLIVKTEENIPIPNNDGISYMYSEPFEVDAVLELPVGGVDKYNIEVDEHINY